MPDNRPSDKDEALNKLLQTWKPEAHLPPRFQEAVWQRIQRAESTVVPLWRVLVSRVEAALCRPAVATAYVAVLLFAGLGAGYLRAEGKTGQAQSEFRSRYVHTVDPYQMPR